MGLFADVAPATVETAVRLPLLALSLSAHEFAHAWTAWRLGDDTAERQGRLTLNPLAHLDPVGTLFILFGPFGWGRPVPFDPDAFRAPVRDGGRVALAGPLANLVVAAVAMVAFVGLFGAVPADGETTFLTFVPPGTAAWHLLALVLRTAAVMNLSLAAFNLVPVPPLDGSHILRALAPAFLGEAVHRCATSGLGLLVFLALVFSGWIDYVFYPVGVVLLVVFHLGLVPAGVALAAALALAGLFAVTLPSVRGAERRSFLRCGRLGLSLGAAAACLGCLGLVAAGMWRLHTAPDRLSRYRREYRAAEARVERREPPGLLGGVRLDLTLPVGPGAPTTAPLHDPVAYERLEPGAVVDVLYAVDASGLVTDVVCPASFGHAPTAFWLIEGAVVCFGVVLLGGALFLWPRGGLLCPAEPRAPRPPPDAPPPDAPPAQAPPSGP